MPTRNINLTSHQDELVATYIATGRYQNASEVIREGLRLMESRDAEEAVRLNALRTAIDIGLDDIAQGRFTEFATGADLAAYLKGRHAGNR